MALSKIKEKTLRENILEVVIGGLVAVSLMFAALWVEERKSHEETVVEQQTVVSSFQQEIKSLKKESTELTEKLDYKVNLSSTIGSVKEDLVGLIQEAVKKRGKETLNPNLEISEADAMRALKSSENRILDEYIRTTALVLATMNTESNFKYKTNNNSNNTKDYGIMQVNDVVIPHLREALGEDLDPINNRNDNVEGGSWEIYECYSKAKDKHPEDVIWWTYAYYNRGLYFENTDAWKNRKNPSYEAVHKQADARSKIFKDAYTFYYNELIEIFSSK